MKKIFGLLATAVFAVCGLSSCGGGGGESEPETMRVVDFLNNTKYFELCKGDRTVYINSNGQTWASTDRENYVLGIKGFMGVGSLGSEGATFRYTITSKDSETGDPLTAELEIDAENLLSGTDDANAILTTFGFAEVNNDGDNAQGEGNANNNGGQNNGDDAPEFTGGSVLVTLNFATGKWVCVTSDPDTHNNFYVRLR